MKSYFFIWVTILFEEIFSVRISPLCFLGYISSVSCLEVSFCPIWWKETFLWSGVGHLFTVRWSCFFFGLTMILVWKLFWYTNIFSSLFLGLCIIFFIDLRFSLWGLQCSLQSRRGRWLVAFLCRSCGCDAVFSHWSHPFRLDVVFMTRKN